MRYLIWDFDNTLAHRQGLWSQCLVDLAAEATPGRSFSREQFVPHLAAGFPWHEPDRSHPHLSTPDAWWANLQPVFVNALVAGAGIHPTVAEAAARGVRARYTDPETWVVYPDTQPVLSQLTSRGWRHVILSNHVPELQQLVAALGLASHFEYVLSSATLGFEKPHPAAFAAALDLLPRGSEVMMVGDNPRADYQGALAAGLRAALVRGSHPGCEPCFPDLHALAERLNAA